MKTRIVNKADVKVKDGRRIGSKYDDIKKKMANLKPGKAIIVEENGTSPYQLRMRLRASLQWSPVVTPKGYVFRMATTNDGKGLVIILLPE